MFRARYGNVSEGPAEWRGIRVPADETYRWNDGSTYVRHAPYFQDMAREPAPVADICGAKVLLSLADSITTDHISPAGAIKRDGPAGDYLIGHQVRPVEFNSYGARRGNHEVMMRGTFANIRIRNELAPGTEGGFTTHRPSGEVMPVYDAAMRYREEGVPLVVFGGKEYGTGSSRDWAAKGSALLGIRAVIVESFERIHRSNLIGMGVLPLEFTGRHDAQGARPRRQRDGRCAGRRRRAGAALDAHLPGAPGGRGRAGIRGPLPHRYRKRARTISGMAASCPMCCATCWPRRPERRTGCRRRSRRETKTWRARPSR